jgi:arylsulfatase A-like enzyme
MTARRPNLLLVITDQQRADTVAPGSACLSPNLQALAERGARFERCYAANPICSPSRASLFTGLLPHAHGVEDVTHAVTPPKAQLRDDVPFWPRDLRAAGYRTGYFGKWHVERGERLEEFGFDTYETELHLVSVPTERRPLQSARRLQRDGYRDLLLYGVTPESATATREHALFERGAAFVREGAEDPDTPWALVVATEAPHDPFVAPAELRDRYDAAGLPLPASAGDPLHDRPAIYRRLQRVWDTLTPDDAREATACYLALCSLIDDGVGRLLEELDRTGQSADTVVVFTSDHGELLGAHGLWLKGVPAFEEVYRVPLLLAGPGIDPGVRHRDPVSLLDLGRTLVRLTLGDDAGRDQHARGTVPGQGRDLSPILRGEAATIAPEAYAEFHGQRFGYTQRIVWFERHKYVFNGFDEDELYDLDADPSEERNLAPDPAYAALLAEMATRMWRIAHATGDATLVDAHYGMFRFAPVGPDAGDPP